MVVHVGGRARRGERVSARARRPGHRDRHPLGPDGQAVRVVQPGRRVDHPALRRHGARARHLQAPRGADGRDDVGGERGGLGVDLPCRPPRGGDRGADSRAAHGAPPQLAGKRILVVDDNVTNHEIVARHARSWGMDAVALTSPLEALARIEGGETFDVAVLDMVMPEMDGLALAREIRRHRDKRELPLVMLTSLGRLPQIRSSGVFSVQLAKPVKASQLYNALLQALAEQLHGAGGRRAGRGQAGDVVAADPPGRGQRREPEGRPPAPGPARLPRRRGGERPRGAGGARAAALRRRAHGRTDARAGRPRCVAPDPRALAGGGTPAHHRDDGERDARGPPGMLRRRDGRLPCQTDPSDRAGGGAEPRPTARGHPHERARRAPAPASTRARSRA